MIVTITVPDEVYAKYAERNPKAPNKVLADVLVKEQDATDPRELKLSQEQRLKVEALLQKKLTSQELVAEIEKLVSVHIGDVSVALSPGQIKRAVGEAKFFKQPISQVMTQKVKQGLNSSFGGA